MRYFFWRVYYRLVEWHSFRMTCFETKHLPEHLLHNNQMICQNYKNCKLYSSYLGLEVPLCTPFSCAICPAVETTPGPRKLWACRYYCRDFLAARAPSTVWVKTLCRFVLVYELIGVSFPPRGIFANIPRLKEHYIRNILSHDSTLAVGALRIFWGKT